MPSQKQNPFCRSSKRRRRSDSKNKKPFENEWKKSLAESDRGSYYTQAEYLGETSTERRDSEGSSFRKIKKPDSCRESVTQDEDDNLTKPKQLNIIDPCHLEAGICESAVCKVCHGELELFMLSNNLSRVEVFKSNICKDHTRHKFKYVPHAFHFFQHHFS